MVAGATEKEYEAVINAILDSGEVDTLFVIYVPISAHGTPAAATTVRDIADRYEGDCTLMSVFMQAEEAIDILNSGDKKVPVYQFPEGAARALAKVVGYGDWVRRDPGSIPKFTDSEPKKAQKTVKAALARLGEEGGWLEPEEVDAVLESFGITLPKSFTVTTEDEAVEVAAKIGGRVVLKVISSEALHKSDVGGVLLNLEGEAAVRDGFKKVTGVVKKADGVLVQEMVGGGHEVLVGVSQDPNFGPLIVYGLGGVYVELLKDVAFRLHPLTDVDVDEMVESIKGAKLLHGYRNMPEGDVDAVKDVLLRVSAMVGAVPEITEMDMNPVKVLEPGKGVRVVDARIKVVPLDPHWLPEVIDIPGRVGHPQH